MRDVNASRRSGNYPTDVTACRVERARKKKLFELQFRHHGVGMNSRQEHLEGREVAVEGLMWRRRCSGVNF